MTSLKDSSRKKYAELHLHSKDRFDSDNPPVEVCKRLSELGAVGFALTQHGVLSGIEAMRDAAKEYNLKFIPGIETYYGNADDIQQNKHLILLAVNYDGYKAIWKAVSDRSVQNNAGYSVMSYQTLKQYFGPGSKGHGNVIATSACINGVIAANLRLNDAFQNAIDKLERRRLKYEISNEQLEGSLAKLDVIQKELNEKNKEKEEIRKVANAKFAKREKFVDKLQAINDPSYQKELDSLLNDKKATAKAKADLETLTKEIKTLKQRQTIFNREIKSLNDKVAKDEELIREIEELKAQMLSDDQLYYAAMEETKKMCSVFGDKNFYMEIQNHRIDKEAQIYPTLVEIARELDVPLVASNDVHMVNRSYNELLKRQILRSMRFEEWEELQQGDEELYIKTDKEMVQILSEIFPQDVVKEAMDNINVIMDRCNVVFPKETHYPTFPTPPGKTVEDVFIEEVKKGMKWRGIHSAEYKDRLNHEFKIIRDMGYLDYLLIVKDFLEYGRALAPVPDEFIADAPLEIDELKAWVSQNDWEGGFTIGPGRGSAAGSLICYCLGITNIDPLQYDLLFERFLNPERVSMPDIDSDIANRIRPKVIEYVKHKYGQDSVCGILTTNAQGPKGVLRIGARYYGKSIGQEGLFLALGDKMAKMVPEEIGITFDSIISFEGKNITVYQMLQKQYESDKNAQTILEWARVMEGCFTAYGAHAAGIVISDGHPVSDYVPLRWNQKLSEMTTQVDMIKVEEKGLIKMDFLGLKTLDIITDCIRLINQNKGILINPLKIPMDDDKVFSEIFSKARTNSVFQFESDGMKNMLKRFQPSSFEDLVILVSMFRPGPIQFLDGVIDVKNGKKEMSFLCPQLKPILEKTYGSIVYQEQTMEIFRNLAGYTLGGADEVRRYMSKKKMDKLVHEKQAFIYGDPERNIAGCIANGISENVANTLFQQITEFAKYAFNKSHAAAYAMNSYYTAWFKLYYPSEFLAAAMNWAENDKIAGLIQEAKLMGVNLLVPDINQSFEDFTVNQNGDIRYGLSAVKTVGNSSKEIILEREARGAFVSLQDFFERVNVKKDVVTNLIAVGAFDAFHKSRKAMQQVVEPFKNVTKKIKDKQNAVSDLQFVLSWITKLSYSELKQKAIEENVVVEISEKDTEAKIEKRLQNAQKALATLEYSKANIIVPDVKEDLSERLTSEKALLGMYISGHPMQGYEKPAVYNAESIESVMNQLDSAKQSNDGDVMAKCSNITVLATISDISIKKTKRGDSFAVLTLEDETKTFSAFVWSNTLPQVKELIQVGSVILASGAVVKKRAFRDKDSYEYSMTISQLRKPSEKQSVYQIQFRNYDDYQKAHAYLYKHYKNDLGHRWIAYIHDIDVFEETDFRVSEDCKKLGGIVEI